MAHQIHIPPTDADNKLPKATIQEVLDERRVWRKPDKSWCSMCRKNDVDVVCVGVKERYVCVCQGCIDDLGNAMASPLACEGSDK